MDLQGWVEELRRRRVFRVLVGYGIGTLIVLRAVDQAVAAARLPEGILSAVVVGLGLGFPVAVGLAWAFDLTARGVTRTPEAAEGRGAGLPRGWRLWGTLVGLGLLAAAPGVTWHFLLRGGRAAAGPSVAVLPFADMSPGHDQEYLSDGIAEEILNALAQVDGLKVAGRTSAFSFKGRNVKVSSIGRELNVAAVLEGSVRKSGDRVRIAARLVSASDGYDLWSETYDRRLDDVFAVQEEIARAVVAALRVRLATGQGPGPPSRPASPEAYAQYLLGRHLEEMGTIESYRLAVQAYGEAIRADPSYAAAHAGLGNALFILGSLETKGPDGERWRQDPREATAVAAAERAIALAPDLPEARAARGYIRTLGGGGWNWEGARDDLERARALRPGDAQIQVFYGHLLAVLGRLDEAIALTRRATELDPLDGIAWRYLGGYQNAKGDLAGARATLERGLQIVPGHLLCRRELAFTDLLEGHPAAVLAAFEHEPLEWLRLTMVALALHDLGREDESRAAAARLEQEYGHSAAYQVAEVRAWRGDAGGALAALEQARVDRDAGLRYVKYDPLLRSIRGDPRYAALLAEVKLPVP